MFIPRCLSTNSCQKGCTAFSCWLVFFSVCFCPEFKRRFIITSYGQWPCIANRNNDQIAGFSFLIALKYRDGCKNKKWQFIRSFMKVVDLFLLYIFKQNSEIMWLFYMFIKLIHLKFAHSGNPEAVKWTAICAISHCQVLMPVFWVHMTTLRYLCTETYSPTLQTDFLWTSVSNKQTNKQK